jgi:hypothetical protein
MVNVDEHIAISKRCQALAHVLQATSTVIEKNSSGYTNVSEAKEIQTKALQEIKRILAS